MVVPLPVLMPPATLDLPRFDSIQQSHKEFPRNKLHYKKGTDQIKIGFYADIRDKGKTSSHTILPYFVPSRLRDGDGNRGARGADPVAIRSEDMG